MTHINRLFPVQAHDGVLWWATFASQAAYVADGSGEKVAYKYFPTTTSPITGVDFRVSWGSASNGTNFKVGVFDHDWANNRPGTNQLGGYSAEFAGGTTANVWVGEKTISPNTGNLTLGDPVWVVIEYSSGTALDATHSVTLHDSNTQAPLRADVNYTMGLAHHNGTNWTTTAYRNAFPALIVHHVNGEYSGLPFTASISTSGQTDIFNTASPNVTNRQGLVFQVSTPVTLLGVYFALAKAGTPGSLTIEVHEGSTLKDSVVRAQNKIFTSSGASENFAYFDSPVQLSANTNLYIIFSQGTTYPNGSDTADYDLNTCAINTTYRDGIVPATWLFVYGTGTDPTAMTTDNSIIPAVFPIIDAFEGFSSAAGGGPVSGNMRGGFVNG